MSKVLGELVPMLICDDVPKMIDFYTGILGFEVVHRMDDIGRSGWASLRNGESRIMLASPTYLPRPQAGPHGHQQVVYYGYPKDVVALQASIRRAGYPCTDLTIRFYGMKEFELRDPEGHCLTFGQETDDPLPPGPHGK